MEYLYNPGSVTETAQNFAPETWVNRRWIMFMLTVGSFAINAHTFTPLLVQFIIAKVLAGLDFGSDKDEEESETEAVVEEETAVEEEFFF